MEEQKELIEPLFERVKEYAKTSFELMRLKAIDKTAEIASLVITRIITSLVFLLFFFLFNVGLSLWIGDLLGKTYYGFFCTAGLYLLIWAIASGAKGGIKKRISDNIVAKITDNG